MFRLNLELLAKDHSFALGEKIPLELVALNRSPLQVEAKSLSLNDGSTFDLKGVLKENQTYKFDLETAPTQELSTPYWLREVHSNLYTITDKNNELRAENRAPIRGVLTLVLNGEEIELPLDADYKWSDPSYGERRSPLIIAPAITASLDQELMLAKPRITKEIVVRLHAYKAGLKEELKVQVPEGWGIDKSTIKVDFTKKHEEQTVILKITPSQEAKSGSLSILDSKGNEIYSATTIRYDHIPTQVIFEKVALKCIPLDVKVKDIKVAYIKGVEDAVADAIRQLGIQVDEYEVADLATLDLSTYQTLVFGIRMYNVHPEMANYHDKIDAFVKAGGNLIIQYNTASRSGNFEPFTPLPFKIGRNRVTEEDAAAQILVPEHPIFLAPNAIQQEDFNAWVQERGLYFAENYAPNYQALISWNDEGENPQEGALIVAQHGEGQVIYTGISFFRELPQGVVGAYRLFANLLSY